MTKKVYYKKIGSKYSRDTGKTLFQLCDEYNTYTNNIIRWRETAPYLDFEEWESQRYKIKYPKISRRKVEDAV